MGVTLPAAYHVLPSEAAMSFVKGLLSTLASFLAAAWDAIFPAWGKFPPGPLLPLPILRNIPGTRFFRKNFVDTIAMLSEEHRDAGAFSLHLGHKRIVVLTDMEEVKSVYGRQCTQRPDTSVGDWRENKFGVIFSNDSDWHEQRKMFVSSLHKTGFRNFNRQKSFEGLWHRLRSVVDANTCMDQAAELAPSDFDLCLTDYVFSLVCDPNVVAGKLKDSPNQTIKNIDYDRTLGIQWCESTLWFRWGLARRFLPEWSGYEGARRKMQSCMRSLKEIVETHRQTSEERRHGDGEDGAEGGGSGQDFIDLYLDKVSSSSQSPWEGQNGMSRLMGALDTIPLGGDGLFMAFNTVIFCLSRFADKQAKLRDSLREVAEDDAWNDEELLKVPYLKAFVMEVFRYMRQSGLGAVKNAKTEVRTKSGLCIPAGTDIYPNADFLMNDPAHWKDPRSFRPERFLGKDGQVVTDPQWTPFGVGPRACPGQSFSMETLLGVTARMVSTYELHFSKFTSEPAHSWDQEETEMVSLGLRKPRNYLAKFEPLAPSGEEHRAQVLSRANSVMAARGA